VKPATDHPLVNENRPDQVLFDPGRPSGGPVASIDRADFQQWAENLRPRLVRLAYRYLWNIHDAEEIVQETLALAWREVGVRVPETEHRDAWLYRVTINLSLNRLRRLRADPMPPTETAATAAHPGSRQEMDELMQRVRLAVRELPDRQQAAIVLRDIEGLAHEQIGEILEVTPAAARVLVHRAREAVRRILLVRWPDSFKTGA
jgi:RNA polymerase sigma factor (sigma-70 family)